MLIAGTQSGCGKTTITLAWMQHLRREGMTVAPFKAGPDFLDPMWHEVACGRTCYNLDSRMMGADHCRALYAQQAAEADVALIEGAMGLFDGASGVGGAGSAAHLARLLDEPVLLVVDAKGMSGSLVALVEGFVARAADMGVTVAGVVANRVGSDHHATLLRELLATHQLPPLVAWMMKEAPRLAERHLGLVMPSAEGLPDFSRCFRVEQEITAPTTQTQAAIGAPMDGGGLLDGVTVAVAKDAAFCFIYAANVAWLRAAGASLLFFSPLAGEPVPDGADALWLPGGYPELHGDALSQSPSWASVRRMIADGKPALAECGGMMVLGTSITTKEGRFPMAGVLPCDFVMQDKLAGLGYREAQSGARGHEFHHSLRHDPPAPPRAAFELARGDGGIRHRNLRASYVHWYFPSEPEAVASWFSASSG